MGGHEMGGHEMGEEEGMKNMGGHGEERGEAVGEREQMEREAREHEGRGAPEPEGNTFIFYKNVYKNIEAQSARKLRTN